MNFICFLSVLYGIEYNTETDTERESGIFFLFFSE